MRYTEPTGSIGAGDRIAAVEPCASKERIKTFPMLPRYRLDILRDGIKQRQLRLRINGVSKLGSVFPQATSINSRPSSRYLIDGEVTLREEPGEP